MLDATHQMTPRIDSLDRASLITVIEALPVGALFVENEEIHCNRRVEELTGYGRGEISCLDDFLTRLFGERAGQARSFFEPDREAGFPAPREFSITSKDGSSRIIEFAGSGSRPLICTMQDVTGYRRGRQEPLEVSGQLSSTTASSTDAVLPADENGKGLVSEALLKAIIDSVPFDFFALDRSGRYTMLSSEITDTWGDAIGKTVPELAAGTCLEPYLPRWLENNRRALAGETVERECMYEWQGELHVIHETTAPIRDQQQRILGTFGINIDVTEQKQIQRALKESEERYRCLSALTSDYVYSCSRTGEEPYRVQWMGGAVEAITGYSEAEIFDLGCWLGMVHPEDRELVKSRKMRLLPGQSCTDEFRLICKNGEICWIRETYRCEAGNFEGELRLFGASRNITQSKQAEMALKNVEEIFRLFLEHSPAYLMFKDENHKVIRVSKNVATLFGVTESELVGRSVADIVPPEMAEKIMQDDLEVLRDGRPTQTEEVLNGRHYSTMRFAIPQSGKSPLTVAIKIDITERKEAEDALCRLNDKLDRRVAERTNQLEAAVLEQESFSYSVSHDLRAPLRHINSFSAILMEEYLEFLPDEAREYLRRICSATRRMGQLIDNLLELSRVSRTPLKRTFVDLSYLAGRTEVMLREIDPDRVVEFVIAPDLYADCDYVLVRQLLENLLGNAWKYTARTLGACIEFGMTRSDGPVFFVKDNGAGFDMSYRDKLFIPFQRLHGSEFEGDGIGLATAQRIVQRHGGSIWAEGGEGEGASFYFSLP